jgi:hypothetical protein
LLTEISEEVAASVSRVFEEGHLEERGSKLLRKNGNKLSIIGASFQKTVLFFSEAVDTWESYILKPVKNFKFSVIARFEGLTVPLKKIEVHWDEMPYRCVNTYQSTRRVSKKMILSLIIIFLVILECINLCSKQWVVFSQCAKISI